MNKNIMIKASALEFVPYYFEVILYDEISDHEFTKESYKTDLEPEEEIKVNAENYEKACIDRIREDFNFEKCTNVKIIKDNGLLELCYIFSSTGYPFEETTLINIDPRPNEDQYEIVL